ncbi:isoprenylcysteine carboxylmethyltransferase family protein [Streptomyces rimosus]|uniref:isoprenylcysteine carboxyl methyltransferase family protein n=1 Tax=Streptomyces rimosus TaxID=1927 RepID=UPI000AF98201|nr:isoprenylcysteine carboxylmethyltransferase family protein [Streptomyces rimosus]
MSYVNLAALPMGLQLLLPAVACERLLELRLSRRHARWAMARGGVEYGRRHFPFMAAAHVGLFLGIPLEVILLHRSFVPVLGWPVLCVQVLVHGGRWWCVRSLGPRWNTRVIVVPGMPLVDRGPYRWMRHPNYLIVAVEGLSLPLVYGAWVTALSFTAANAAVLSVRLRVENSALSLPARTS